MLLLVLDACDVHLDHGCTCVRQAAERGPRRGQESAQERVEVRRKEARTVKVEDGDG